LAQGARAFRRPADERPRHHPLIATVPSPIERLLRRDRRLILGALALLAALAWVYLIDIAVRMSEMPMPAGMSATMMMPQPWTPLTSVLTFLMWWIMMIGMMVPSVAPTILLYGRIQRQQLAGEAPYTRTALFAAGYLGIWGAFSLAATAAQWALNGAALLSMSMTVGTSLATLLLVGGGLYQLTPLKRACLERCRSPAEFLASHWRAGGAGALRMGAVHGAFCVGCCWLLMALLFVGGVMNLIWVAALAVLVLVEKLLPRGDAVAMAAGVVMVASGIAVAVRALV
jgi:predicted metal-binding membrane protein